MPKKKAVKRKSVKRIAKKDSRRPAMYSIKKSWSILEEAAEGEEEILPKGATQKQIEAAEKACNLAFPATYREFIATHDGSGWIGITPFKIGGGTQRFLSIKEVCETHRRFTELISRDSKLTEWAQSPDGHPVQCGYWNNGWLPITENGCGDHIFIDLSPSPTGAIGQVVDWWHETLQTTLLAKSFQGWFAEIAGDVKSGTYQFSGPEEEEEEE